MRNLFYQLQKNYVYELTCELFRGEDEILDTGIEEIDDSFDTEGNIRSLTLVGSGSTATAISGRVESGASAGSLLPTEEKNTIIHPVLLYHLPYQEQQQLGYPHCVTTLLIVMEQK